MISFVFLYTRATQTKPGKIIYSNSWKKYSTITLIFNSVPKTLRASSNVTLRQEFLGRRCLLVAVPASHAPPTLPLHMICSDVHVQRPLGVKRFENRRVSPYCSHRAGTTELTSHRPSLISGDKSQAIHCAQTFRVQFLCNDSVRRTDTALHLHFVVSGHRLMFHITNFIQFFLFLHLNDTCILTTWQNILFLIQ